MTAQLLRPSAGEYTEFYAGYVAEMPDGDLLTAMERQGEETFALFSALPEERGAYRYAPGKWVIKDVVGQLARHLPEELQNGHVRPLGLDRFGLRLRVEAECDDHDVRIAFSQPVSTPAELAAELRRLMGCPFLASKK